MTRTLLFAGFIFSLFWGCTKSPKIAAPAYLQIDDYRVITDSGTQGTNYQVFTDVLLETSTTNYGYYPIPGKIPIPFTGNSALIIRPVVRVNGVSALRVDYPMMKGSDTTLSLAGGQILKFKPIFKYFPSVNFRFMENFETLATSIVNSNTADTFCIKMDYSQHFNGGSRSLLMQVDQNHTTCQAQSYNAFYLPNGPNVYMEINYKSTTDFEMGLIGTDNPSGALTDQRSVGGAVASATWKKFYVDLTALVRTPPSHPYYYLYFYKDSYDINGGTINQIFIDNIKVISQN